MIEVGLLLFGLALGSFVNALVWRLHEQAKEESKKKPSQKYLEQLSIIKGRSMCPHCKHELKVKDLIPVISWLSTRGRCRYCGKSIGIQYPLVELLTGLLFLITYILWPEPVEGLEIAVFILWMAILVGFVALLVYDLRWKLLPNRITYPLSILAGLFALLEAAQADKPLVAFINVILAVGIGGGLFYVLYQTSKGRWIGGGDVKLGWILGLVVATPGKSMLMIFLASLLGTIVSLPLLASKRLNRHATIPFGPFLIIAAIIVVLFGDDILRWYVDTFLTFAY